MGSGILIIPQLARHPNILPLKSHLFQSIVDTLPHILLIAVDRRTVYVSIASLYGG